MSGFFNANKLVKRVDRLELLNSTLEIPSPSWGIIEGNLQDQEDLQTALDSKGGLRTFNQWSGTNIYTGQVQFHNTVYFNDRTGIMFDPESTSISKQAYAQIAYRASTDRHFKFKVHGVPNSLYWGNLDFSGILSSDKTFTFPNKSGTIALLDDVSGGVTTGFGLSTNGSGELQLGDDLLLPGVSASQVNVPDVGALIFGDFNTSNYPRILIDNNSSNDGYRSVGLRVGEDSVDDVHTQISISNNVAGEYVNIIGQNNDPLVNTHHAIGISDQGIELEAWSQLTSDVSSIRVEPTGITLSNNVYVPTPTADSHAATKAYVDANVGGFSGSFVTATDTITVVNGLITAVIPL